LNSPFNETKYNSLLNGLEVSEVNFLELSTIIDYRIEAEFFDKTTLQLIKKLRIGQHEIIGDSYDSQSWLGYESGPVLMPPNNMVQ
jgi:hypothetical protein